MRVDMIAVIMVFLIPLVAIIGGIFLAALKVMKGESGKKHRQMQSDEARMIQDIYNSLTRMESRIEALETIMLDRAEAKESQKQF